MVIASPGGAIIPGTGGGAIALPERTAGIGGGGIGPDVPMGGGGGGGGANVAIGGGGGGGGGGGSAGPACTDERTGGTDPPGGRGSVWVIVSNS